MSEVKEVANTKADMEPCKLQGVEVTQSEGNVDVRQVHLVYKSHYDIGFTNSAAKMVHDTINWQLPTAIAQCEQLRKMGFDGYYAWTLPSWLVWLALGTKSGEELASLETAIRRGDVVWTAAPFTPHAELMDESLFEHSVNISKMLDQRFGTNTTAIKFTDVPGYTKGIIKILAKKGIKLMQIGVNHMSAMPDTPPIFIWRDDEGNEIVVMYCRGYGDTVRFPGTDVVLAQVLKGDNMELAGIDEVVRTVTEIKRAYPNAEVKATSYNAFADEVLGDESVRKQLPVVTGEIGDSWIHGVGSDPLKVARFRALSRLRRSWLEAGRVNAEQPDIVEFSNNLMLVAEHTWGVSHQAHLNDLLNWDNEAFDAVRHRGNYKTLEASWQEQRDYIEYAIESLTDAQLKREAFDAIIAIEPQRPIDMLRGANAFNPQDTIEYKGLKIQISAKTGAIVQLDCTSENAKGQTSFADEAHPLGEFIYRSYNQDDFRKHIEHYCAGGGDFLLTEFGKKGIENTYAQSKYHKIEPISFMKKETDEGLYIIVPIRMEAETVEKYGGAHEVYNTFFIPATIEDVATGKRRIEITLSWFDKTATRLPESIWYRISPICNDIEGWRVQKTGCDISPMHVVARGGNRLHAVQDGVFVDGKMSIKSLDTALVSPGEPGISDCTTQYPNMDGGWYFNLFNNIWNTNFVAWYGDDGCFRFEFEF